MFLETLVVGSMMVNCYIVGCEKTGEAVVIDPGDEVKRIIAAVNDEGLKVRYIIFTHAHFDHIGAAKQLAEATGAKVLVHESDAPLLKLVDAQAAFFHMPAPPAPKADGTVKEGDVIEFGEMRMRVIHTPGHSPGGICLYIEDEGVVFTGDTLFWGSIGRTDLPGSDHAAIIRSLKEKLAALPDETKAYPGHFDETEIGFEKKQNPFFE